jgi:hypothetical protein
MEDAEDAHEPADIMGGCGQLDAGVGRSAEQDIVEIVWMTTDERAPLLGHGKDHGNGGDRQEFWTPRCQPGFGLEARTRGATAVPAGVVDVVFLATGLARPQVSAYGLGATGDEVIHGAAVAGQDVVPKPLQVRTPVASEDVCPLWHGRAPAR